MQLFLQQFQACNIHIEKQNYLRMFRKVACPFWSFQQPWLWWRFSHRTFTISKLPLFGNQSNMRITFELSWARGTRHAEIALLPVPLPVLIISITEHAPHPPSSHICLTSVWPFCRRYESKVSFKLTFDTSYSSLFTVNLCLVLEHRFPSISSSSKQLTLKTSTVKLIFSVRRTGRPN